MMKLNNKATLRLLLRLHILLLVTAVFALAGLGFLFPHIFRQIKYVGLVFGIYQTVRIFRLTYIEYENSGEVLTLRSYGIFQKKYEGRQVELPLEKINKLYLEKTFWVNYLIIIIKKGNAKMVKIHFPVHNLKKKDLLQIENTFIRESRGDSTLPFHRSGNTSVTDN